MRPSSLVQARRSAWEKVNPELAAKYASFIKGELPEIDFAAIEQKAGVATLRRGLDRFSSVESIWLPARRT